MKVEEKKNHKQGERRKERKEIKKVKLLTGKSKVRRRGTRGEGNKQMKR